MEVAGLPTRAEFWERVGDRHPELRNYLRVPQTGPRWCRILVLVPNPHHHPQQESDWSSCAPARGRALKVSGPRDGARAEGRPEGTCRRGLPSGWPQQALGWSGGKHFGFLAVLGEPWFLRPARSLRAGPGGSCAPVASFPGFSPATERRPAG